MQARYYDPVIGRFYSNNPVDALSHLNTPNSIHGFNRYAYANNNPYKFTDPTGVASDMVINMVNEAEVWMKSLGFENQSDLNQNGEAAAKAAASQVLKNTSDVATGVAILSPQGRGVAGAISIGADALDILHHSENPSADGAIKAAGEIMSKVAENKVKPLLAIKQIGANPKVNQYAQETIVEITKTTASQSTEALMNTEDK